MTPLLALLLMMASPSLQARVDAAAPGAVLELAAGLHQGPVVLRRAVTLRGVPGSVVRGDGRGHVITIAGAGVTVEGLAIEGSGLDLGKDHAAIFVQGADACIRRNRITESLHGVYVKKADRCRIEENEILGKEEVGAGPSAFGSSAENCDTTLNPNRRGNGIHLWNSREATLTGNRISGARDGIYFSFTNGSRVRGNTITRVRFALHYMYSDDNTFESNHFGQSDAGAVMMYSRNLVVRRNTFASNVGHRAYGVVMIGVDRSWLEENTFFNNSVGLFLDLSNGNTFIGNRVLHSYVGARLSGSSDSNRFSRNRFAGNLHPVEIDGTLGTNEWALGGVGNDWGGPEVDLDGDGKGELPHREADLLGPLRRPFPAVALLSGSPALGLVRFAVQSSAIPRVPAITDPAPLAFAP